MKYKKCVRPVRASCPRGVTLLDETDRMRRVYNMRMEYVCREEKELYLKYLYCYQEVVVNNKLQSCMHIWNKVRECIWQKIGCLYQFVNTCFISRGGNLVGLVRLGCMFNMSETSEV